MKNFVQDGDTLALIAPYDVGSGAGAKIGNLFGVAVADVASGKTGQFKMSGVFDLPKVSAQAWASVGTLIYWDDGDKVCTTDDDGGSNLCIGINVAAAANPSATGRVRLNIGPQGIQGIQGEPGGS